MATTIKNNYDWACTNRKASHDFLTCRQDNHEESHNIMQAATNIKQKFVAITQAGTTDSYTCSYMHDHKSDNHAGSHNIHTVSNDNHIDRHGLCCAHMLIALQLLLINGMTYLLYGCRQLDWHVFGVLIMNTVRHCQFLTTLCRQGK